VSFEALNIASLWHLPVLFVCENNSTSSWAPGEGNPKLVAAATELAGEGIEAEVVGLRTIAPLDEKTILDSVVRSARLVVVDECPLRCGIAPDVAGIVAEHGFDLLEAPIQLPTIRGHTGPRDERTNPYARPRRRLHDDLTLLTSTC
jgi:pyruvate/2-oxoglutarate/acetoin dehydrogenase E1 component